MNRTTPSAAITDGVVFGTCRCRRFPSNSPATVMCSGFLCGFSKFYFVYCYFHYIFVN